MKGIVVDRKGRHAVVLTGDGSFSKIHNQDYFMIGHEIEFEKPFRTKRSMLAKISSIAAAALFILGLSYGAYSYTMPYSYVDVDINPSLELTANIYDIIIKTETFNEDGEKLLEKHKLTYKKLDAGITELVNSAIEQGYLKTQAKNAVLLTVTSKDEQKGKKLEKHVEDAALKALDQSKVNSAVISRKVSSQNHDTAKEMGISPGKLALIEKAMSAQPGLKLEELKDAPVKAIMKHIKKGKKPDKQDEKQNEGKQDNKGRKRQNGEDIKQKNEDVKKDKKIEWNKDDRKNREKKYEDTQQERQTVNPRSNGNKQKEEYKDSRDDNRKKYDKKDKVNKQQDNKNNRGSDTQRRKNKH